MLGSIVNSPRYNDIDIMIVYDANFFSYKNLQSLKSCIIYEINEVTNIPIDFICLNTTEFNNKSNNIFKGITYDKVI